MTTLAQLLGQLGAAVVDAQTLIDRHSIALMEDVLARGADAARIREPQSVEATAMPLPLNLTHVGELPSFYDISEVTIDLALSVTALESGPLAASTPGPDHLCVTFRAVLPPRPAGEVPA